MPRTIQLKRPRGRPAAAGLASQAGSVQSLDRALALMELIAAEDGISLTDLSQRAGLAPSTTHRILGTLEAHEYVSQDSDRGLWLIGVKAFEVGSAFLRNRKLFTIGRAIMRGLAEATGESVNVAVEDEGSIVYISQIESHHPIRAFQRPGSRSSMHASGIGKALLAARPDEEVRAILQRTGMPRFTPRTLDDPARLFADLAGIRKRGWAIDDEERQPGMRCVAAPIYNEYGEAIAGISITGPSVRMTDERLGEFGPLVKRAAAEMTRSNGGRDPGAPQR